MELFLGQLVVVEASHISADTERFTHLINLLVNPILPGTHPYSHYRTKPEHIPRTYTQHEHISRTYTQHEHIPRTYTQHEHIPRTYTQHEHIPRTYTQHEHIPTHVYTA